MIWQGPRICWNSDQDFLCHGALRKHTQICRKHHSHTALLTGLRTSTNVSRETLLLSSALTFKRSKLDSSGLALLFVLLCLGLSFSHLSHCWYIAPKRAMCIWHHALFPHLCAPEEERFCMLLLLCQLWALFSSIMVQLLLPANQGEAAAKGAQKLWKFWNVPYVWVFTAFLSVCMMLRCPMQPRPVRKIEHNPLLNKKHFWLSRYKNMMDACQVNLGAVSAAGLMPGDDFLQNLGMDFYCWLLRQDHGFDGRHSYFKRWGTGHLISMWAACVDFKRRQHWF